MEGSREGSSRRVSSMERAGGTGSGPSHLKATKGKQCLYLIPCVFIVLQCDPIGLDLREKVVTDGQSWAGHSGMARATQPLIP